MRVLWMGKRVSLAWGRSWSSWAWHIRLAQKVVHNHRTRNTRRERPKNNGGATELWRWRTQRWMSSEWALLQKYSRIQRQWLKYTYWIHAMLGRRTRFSRVGSGKKSRARRLFFSRVSSGADNLSVRAKLFLMSSQTHSLELAGSSDSPPLSVLLYSHVIAI